MIKEKGRNIEKTFNLLLRSKKNLEQIVECLFRIENMKIRMEKIKKNKP